MDEPSHAGLPSFGQHDERTRRVDLVVLHGVADGMANAAAGQVEDRVDAVAGAGHRGEVPDVAADNLHARRAQVLGQVFSLAGREIVQHADAAIFERVDEMRADEAGAAGDQNLFSG